MIGKNLKELTSPEMFQKILEETATRRKGDSSSYELQVLRKNGRQRILTIIATPTYTENGLHKGSFGIFHDITERKLAEKALKESEDLYRTLVETSTDGIVLTDLNGKYLFCNTMQAEILGYENSAEIIGKNGFAFIAPESQEESKKTLQKLQKEKSVQGEFKIIRKDGSVFPAEYSSTKINDEKGNPVSILVMIRDISDRKQAEEKLASKSFTI